MAVPEMTMHVRWPDGTLTRHAAQGAAVREALHARRSYALGEFLHRSRCAWHAERAVRPQGGAVRELVSIETAAAQFAADPAAVVVVERFAA